MSQNSVIKTARQLWICVLMVYGAADDKESTQPGNEEGEALTVLVDKLIQELTNRAIEEGWGWWQQGCDDGDGGRRHI
ncbi:hypothetical protein PIB30_057493 [Stylosanthes scabra]|uniref:Secreted protein n=1 Tax=Stylosanthes scabra TaxID=79078 RepID=A0ABU6XI08_9FABA|nr:hypothetical protein [Stylosanthes scabra]